MIDRHELIDSLSHHAPSLLRWAGAIAKELRRHEISVGGKSSGYANTDALTLADLSLQQLLVDGLRDLDPLFRECRIEAEETTGDLDRFAKDSDYVIGLDPIDGTKQYRDHTGQGWSVMLHLRNATEVLYSLLFIPAAGVYGRWVEVRDDWTRNGPDDPSQPARAALDALSSRRGRDITPGKKFYLIGFVGREEEAAKAVNDAGLEGVDANDTPGCLYDLMASGEFGGSLIHSPNVYDYPVSLQIARQCGGDSVYVRSEQPVDFRDLWLDETSNMWRLHGIVGTATDPDDLPKLAALARDWSGDRYQGDS